MKKILFIFILIILFGCETKYKRNYQINNRKSPIIIIATDSITNSVVLRDGDNQVFTIYDTPTTSALTKSLTVGDTIRVISNF